MQNPDPPRHVALIGGSGFVGQHVAHRLFARGISFTNLDRVAPTAPGPAADHWQMADLSDLATLRDGIADSTDVMLLAAEWRDDVSPVSRYFAVNVDGTRNVLSAMQTHGIHRVIFTSSVSVYGPTSLPVDEAHPPSPINPYGQSKLEAEAVLRQWAAANQGSMLTIVRPTVIFGPGNRGNVWNLISQMAQGPFVMIGDGHNRKSMAYVENVADFLIHCLQMPQGQHLFNYADGPDYSMNELVALVDSRLGKPSRPNLRIPRSLALLAAHVGEVLARMFGRSPRITRERVFKFCANTQYAAHAAHQSGYRPRVALDRALSLTIDAEFGSKE